MASFSPPQQLLFLLGCLSRSLQSIICCWVHPGVPLSLTGSWGAGGCLPLPPSFPISPLPCPVGFWRQSLPVVFPSCVLWWDCRFRRGFVPLVSLFPPLDYSWWLFQCLLKASAPALFSYSPFQKQTLCRWTNFLPFAAQAAWLSLLILASQPRRSRPQPRLYLLSCSMSSVTALRSESRTSCTNTTS